MVRTVNFINLNVLIFLCFWIGEKNTIIYPFCLIVRIKQEEFNC